MRNQPLQAMNNRAQVNIVARPEYPLHIQMLFTARPPLPYLKPPSKPRCRKLDAISNGPVNYLDRFEEEPDEIQPYVPPQSLKQQKKQVLIEKLKQHQIENLEALKEWKPMENKDINSDPQKTLFVARLSHTARDKHLKREFENFGPVKKVSIVKDKKNDKPKGYAFIEFEQKRDMNYAYKEADGMKVDNRRIQVDYERGRIMKDFVPKRFGGGKGKTRLNKDIDALLENEFKQKRIQIVAESKMRSRSRSHERKKEKKEEKKDEKKEEKKDQKKDKKEKKDKDSKKDKDHKKDKKKDKKNKSDHREIQPEHTDQKYHEDGEITKQE